MATVRLRDASEYPDPAQRLFELSKIWFNHDFKEPAAMSRVMAWDRAFGGPHGRAMKRGAGGERGLRRPERVGHEAGDGARRVQPRREGDGGRRRQRGECLRVLS